MRAFNIGLVVIGVLFGVAGASHKMVTAGTANFEAHDAVIYGLHIALPGISRGASTAAWMRLVSSSRSAFALTLLMCNWPR
jgi:undecaprenyl pyrophosphate phosphatase UppP